MADQRTPLDKGPISDEDRAWIEFNTRNGRVFEAPAPPSRSRIGRILDFFDSASKGARNSRW